MLQNVLRSIYWIGAVSASFHVASKFLNFSIFREKAFFLADAWLLLSSLFVAGVVGMFGANTSRLSLAFLESLAAMMFYAPMSVSSLVMYLKSEKHEAATLEIRGKKVSRDRALAVLAISFMNVVLLYDYLRNPLSSLFAPLEAIYFIALLTLSFASISTWNTVFNFKKISPLLIEAYNKNKLSVALFAALPLLILSACMNSLWGGAAVVVLTLLSYAITLWDPKRLQLIFCMSCAFAAVAAAVSFIWPSIMIEDRGGLFQDIGDAIGDQVIEGLKKKLWPFQ
jgi:hypothetical protein